MDKIGEKIGKKNGMKTGQMIAWRDCRIFLPMPVMVVVEDVGWWQGADGSRSNQPFRSGLNRRHCLADYRALARFAEGLSMKIVLGMVLCEWDRTNILKHLPTATWGGESWDNAENQGPWLDEAADYIRGHSHVFEPALHGVGHEFWQNGIMERSEFHDDQGRMRDSDRVRAHLNAFAALWRQNCLGEAPKVFIPPALNHSYGNQTIQSLLKGLGIDYVITRFSRMRQYAPLAHPCLTWESDVTLLDRGEALVPWHRVGAAPEWTAAQPILPFHWANLLHENPEFNFQVVDGWVALLAEKLKKPDLITGMDVKGCFSQAAACFLGQMALEKGGLVIDLSQLPATITGDFWINIQGAPSLGWECRGGQIQAVEVGANQTHRFLIRPAPMVKKIFLSAQDADSPGCGA